MQGVFFDDSADVAKGQPNESVLADDSSRDEIGDFLENFERDITDNSLLIHAGNDSFPQTGGDSFPQSVGDILFNWR